MDDALNLLCSNPYRLCSDSVTTGTPALAYQGFSGWQAYTTTFTATSASETLTFTPTGSGQGGYVLLDGVSHRRRHHRRSPNRPLMRSFPSGLADWHSSGGSRKGEGVEF
jgi:hypothetical protein